MQISSGVNSRSNLKVLYLTKFLNDKNLELQLNNQRRMPREDFYV